MADLTSKPAASITPQTIGAVILSEAPFAPIWAIAPYRGQTDALSKALLAAHGLAFPAPNQMTQGGALRAVWSGMDQAFLIGARADPTLAQHAALTDQSDAWCHLTLDGPDVTPVLARLVPVDLSERAFGTGEARRSSLGHMAALFVRVSDTKIDVLVFRSMAATACHEITRAMRSVAARG